MHPSHRQERDSTSVPQETPSPTQDRDELTAAALAHVVGGAASPENPGDETTAGRRVTITVPS